MKRKEMGYFPAFIKLENKKVLIIGGGKIAYEKLERLLDFTHDLHIISLDYSAQMLERIGEENLTFEKRAYQKGDIKEFAIVIIAVDDIDLQAQIYEESKAYKCLCNAVDSVDYCDFIFPSYVKKESLTIAISTSGVSPAFAKHLKRYLLEHIPADISVFLEEMKTLRTLLPKGKERMELLDQKAQAYIKSWKRADND